MRTTLTILALLISALLIAQVPALIPYQAIARNAAGEPLASSTLNARFTIHDGTASGVLVWQELQTLSTTALGLFTAQLGSNVPLAGVNWATSNKFMQVEIDLGQGFIDMGTQQLLSVPYSLFSLSSDYANRSELASNGFAGVSSAGDTLYLANGNFVIVPGISHANNGGIPGNTAHSCGKPNVHNPDLTYGSMTDQQGRVYKTIVIGTQEWMAENLNTSTYRNGDAIPVGIADSDWQISSYTPQAAYWTYYNGEASYACPYGKLYNGYACSDSRQLCPVGWHVPSDAEWTVLTDFLGGEIVAVGKMKTTGTSETTFSLWFPPNMEASNSSGFSATPGGLRTGSGEYYNLGLFGYYWSSSEVDLDGGWMRLLNVNSGVVQRGYYPKSEGLSVRCLRD